MTSGHQRPKFTSACLRRRRLRPGRLFVRLAVARLAARGPGRRARGCTLRRPRSTAGSSRGPRAGPTSRRREPRAESIHSRRIKLQVGADRTQHRRLDIEQLLRHLAQSRAPRATEIREEEARVADHAGRVDHRTADDRGGPTVGSHAALAGAQANQPTGRRGRGPPNRRPCRVGLPPRDRRVGGGGAVAVLLQGGRHNRVRKRRPRSAARYGAGDRSSTTSTIASGAVVVRETSVWRRGSISSAVSARAGTTTRVGIGFHVRFGIGMSRAGRLRRRWSWNDEYGASVTFYRSPADRAGAI